jgi:hypothetical protein
MANVNKMCSSCLKLLPTQDFYPSKVNKGGLTGKCKVCDNVASHVRYSLNKESSIQRTKAYKAEHRDETRADCRKYWLLNKAKYAANTAKYRGMKRNATPTWLTKDQLDEIENFYWLSNDLTKVSGEVYHVDHIVPIQGKTVCGLHVPWNLQILPADLNIAKSNRC